MTQRASLAAHDPGILFVMIGPGGAGKNTLMYHVLADTPNLKQLATATTRAPRQNEAEGREHLFKTVQQFQQMRDAGELMEWQEVTAERFYGIPGETVEAVLQAGPDLIADIDVLGAMVLRLRYPRNTVLVFVQAPSLEALEARLRKRSADPEPVIAERMQRARIEMQYRDLCDYVITNADENVDASAQILREIIHVERMLRRLDRSGVTNGFQRAHFAYHVWLTPVYGTEVLTNSSAAHGYYTCVVRPSELPYEAALRCAHELAQAEPGSVALLRDTTRHGSFVPPLSIDSHDDAHQRQIRFHYACLLPERATPSDGEWTALSDLPADRREMLSFFLTEQVNTP